MTRRSRRSDEELRVRQLMLGAGETVTVPGRMRRTSARGWGPWTDALLELGARGSGLVSWEASDPGAVGLVPSRGRAQALTHVSAVKRRPVRFRAEAFHGMDAEIIVVDADRHTLELSVAPADTDEVHARIRALLDDGPATGA